jgi:hypothetical protein
MSSASTRRFFGFYVGRGDALFRAEKPGPPPELVSAGIPHIFKVYVAHMDSGSGRRTLIGGWGWRSRI